MTLGGKARRSPAARLLLEPGQSFDVKAPPPLADDLARRVETRGYDVISQALACQEYNLGPDDVTIRRRILPCSPDQLRVLLVRKAYDEWALP
jgi:hypothetical protein